MAVPARVETTPWAASRRRAEALRDRHEHAAQVLHLYLALLPIWEESWAACAGGSQIAKHAGVSRDLPTPSGADVAGWAAEEVLPKVVAATAEAGPRPLVESLMAAPVDDTVAAEQLMSAWLRGEDLVPVERFLARASLRGPLAAVDVGAACAADPAPRGDLRCPRCGGRPQLSFRADTGSNLVNGSRQLQCARCGHDWAFSGSTCASCGESRGGKRTVYAEQRDGPQVGRADDGDARFPHLRIEACDTCRHYLIDVDLGHDPRAVPEVDELAALPLDLYATEQGLTKTTPNVMGF
jgi:Protein involved in formate dehydrogenase formation